MADSLGIEILKNLCYHREKMLIIFGLLATLFLLSLVGLTALTPGTSSYAVNVFNVIGLATLMVLCGALMTVCFKSDFRFR